MTAPISSPPLEWPKTGSESYLPLAKARVGGPGGGLYFSYRYAVLIQKTPDEPPSPGWLDVELVKRT